MISASFIVWKTWGLKKPLKEFLKTDKKPFGWQLPNCQHCLSVRYKHLRNNAHQRPPYFKYLPASNRSIHYHVIYTCRLIQNPPISCYVLLAALSSSLASHNVCLSPSGLHTQPSFSFLAYQCYIYRCHTTASHSVASSEHANIYYTKIKKNCTHLAQRMK